jgi:outer membrane protein assembly factor BamB
LRRSRIGGGLAVAGLLLAAGCSSSSSGSNGPESVRGTARGLAPSPVALGNYSAWPEAECDGRHTATSAVVGPQTAHLKWRVDLGGPVTEGPTIGPDGTIYEASDSGVLHALDPRTGRSKWTYNGGGPLVGGDLSTSSAVLPDGTVAWPGPLDTLFGLSPAGALLWKLHLSGQPLSPVVANDTNIYVMTATGTLSAIKVSATGAAGRWSIPLGTVSYGSPVIRPDGVIETTVDDSLVAIKDNGASATQLWRTTITKAIEVSPAVTTTGLTVLGTNDGNVYGVSSSGKLAWKHPIDTYSYSSPAVSPNGDTYIGDNHGNLSVLTAATGASVQVDHAPVGQIWTAPAVDGRGNVYFGTNSGNVYGFSASGRQLFDLDTRGLVASYPALSASGDLLIGSHSGYLYSIGS